MKQKKFTAIYLIILVFLGQLGCSLKTPPTEVPKPKDNRFHKSFFVQWDEKNKVETGKKTFLCGNSFLSTWGRYKTSRINNNNNLRNCNNIFEITSNELIARHVNPGLPGQYSNWNPIMSFRIQHYNVEKARDGYGRDTNKTVETAQYDHWENQEYIEIDFSSMKIINFEKQLVDVDGVDEFDFDKEGGFLGFTADVNSSVFRGSKFHGALRVNFLEMPKTEGFEVTPYHKEISQHANVLNIMGGKRSDGSVFTLMGKWNTKKKNKFYINNFPEEYQDVAVDVVNEWNDVFEKIGHGRPLEPVIGEQGLSFDLRKSAITWINDKRLSNGGLLGIAQNTADVTTGEMHWGAVSVWVDFLRRMIDVSLPSEAFSGSESGSYNYTVQTGFLHESFNRGIEVLNLSEQLPSSLDEIRESIAANYAVDIDKANENLVLLRQNDLGEEQEKLIESEYRRLGLLRNEYVRVNERTLDILRREMPGRFHDEYKDFVTKSNQQINNFSNLNMQKLIGHPELEDTLAFFNGHFSDENISDHSSQAVLEKIIHEMKTEEGFHCDRTAGDYLSALGSLKEFDNKDFLNKDDIFRVVLKFLLSHELGHVLGLGHNFKENIMPKIGSVPSEVYEDLLAKHDDNLKNITSVMGYPSSRTEVLFDYDEIKPFIGDEHTMQLIYNQKYPMYTSSGDGSDCFSPEDGDCFEWGKLENDGQFLRSLEKDGKELGMGFLPFCSNGDQFIGDDPYCQTNDRGSSAVELVQNYIENFNDYVSTGLYNIKSDLSTRPFYVEEQYLWWKSLSAFSKMRVFYDYMRKKYDGPIFEYGAKSIDDQYYTEFSKACELAYNNKFEEIEQQSLKELFTDQKDNQEFLDLCYASKKSIDYIGSLISLSGKDYTVIDESNRSFVWQQIEGEQDYDMTQAYGTWHELARKPLKFSALYALTLPFAFRAQSWRGVVFPSPIYHYSRESARYHFSILYPKEYNRSLTDGALASLHFGDNGEAPYIGASVLAMGYLKGMLSSSNDTKLLRAKYLDVLQSQTAFDLSTAIVEVTKQKNDDDDKLARKFNATLKERWGTGATPLKNFYFYKDNQVVLDPPARTLLYPMGSVFWYSSTTGVMRTIKVSYNYSNNKLLSENSLKSQLVERLNYLMNNCIDGGDSKNGLMHYFNDTDSSDNAFKGFDFSLSIMDNEDQFYHSIDKAYDYYFNEAFPDNKPDRTTCDKAIRAQNLLVTAAGMLNGIYFPEAYDFLEKGAQ